MSGFQQHLDLRWTLAILVASMLAALLLLWKSRRDRLRQARSVQELAARNDILSRRERLLGELLDTTTAAICFIGTDGMIKQANRRMAEMFRGRVEELVGSAYANLAAPGEREMVQRRLDAYVADPSLAVDVERIFWRLDQTQFLGHVTGNRLNDESGRERGLVAVIEDVTARRRTEQALKDSESRYRRFAEELPLGIVITQESRVKYVNPATAKMIGYPVAEILGEPFLTFVADADRAWVMDLHQRRMRGEPVTPAYTVGMVRKDGEIRQWRLSSSTIEWDGRPSALAIVVDITERMQMEEKAARSEALLNSHFESNQLGIAFTSSDKTWLKANRRMSTMLGYTADELRPLTWTDLTHPDDLQASLAQFARILSGEIDQYTIEKRFVHKDGSPVHVNMDISCYRKLDGSIDYVMASIQDITSRKVNEAKIVATQERLEAALNAIPDLLFEVDEDGRIHDYRAHRADLLAVPPAEFLGKCFSDVLPGEAAAVCQSAIGEASLSGWSVGGTYALALPQGEHWFELSVARMFGVDAPNRRFILLARDITERRRSEDALAKSQAALRRIASEQQTILDTDLVGIAKFRQRSIVWANPGFEKIFGYGPGAAVGVPARRHYRSEEAYVALGEAAYPLIERGEKFAAQIEQVRPDGRPIWLELSGAMLDREKGESLWAFVDVTARKRQEGQLLAAKEAAEAANLAKTRFLAAASHDLWQPIQAINLFHDALKKSGFNEKQEHLSGKLAESVRSLRDILSALIEITRLDSGAVRIEQRRVTTEELFYWIDSVFSPLALAKNLRFKLHFPVGGLAVFTDVALLRSMLSNLIGNAIRYTDSGGVLVGVRRRGDRALVQVWDTGIGIAKEDMDNIFEEYYQVGNPERDVSKGLGLGLSIVRRLADLLQFELSFASRVGSGTVFQFYLPLAPSLSSEPAAVEQEDARKLP